jgi:hypothetical protein
MKQCMIVETRDPAGHLDFDWMAELALGLRREGVKVAMLLTENGTFGGRANVAPCLQRLVAEGIPVLADRFALEERGIAESNLMSGVEPCEIGVVVEWLEAGASVLWR